MKARIAWLVAGVLVTMTVIPATAFALWYRIGVKGTYHAQRQVASYSGQPATLNVQLVITDDCPNGLFDSVCAVDYVIAVPPGTALNLLTDDGDIQVTDTRAHVVTATSSSGNVWLRSAAAPQLVRALANSGNVTVLLSRGLSYDVQPVAASGNVTMSVSDDPSVPRYVSATSDSGNVTVRYR